MKHLAIEIPAEAIGNFCQRNRIRKLALFGSVLRDDFSPESDLDVLVKFKPGEAVGFFWLARVQDELSELMGRQVDLNTFGMLSPYFRDEALDEAGILYGTA